MLDKSKLSDDLKLSVKHNLLLDLRKNLRENVNKYNAKMEQLFQLAILGEMAEDLFIEDLVILSMLDILDTESDIEDILD